MENILIVDRIVEGYAHCEDPDREPHIIALSQLPKGIREGSVLRRADGGYQLDHEETARRKALNHNLLTQLIEKNKGRKNS